MTWLDPAWLWALLALPLLAVALVAWSRDRRRAGAAYADPRLLDLRPPRRVLRLRVAAATLALLAVGMAAVAMARPARDTGGRRARSTVVIAVDTSKSMTKTDLAPSRLAAAVVAARRFLDVAPRDTAIGLVTFANGAVVRVPPVTDRTQVSRALDHLPIGVGTAIGDGVVASLDTIQASGALAGRPQGTDPSPARILLMTDGANSAGSNPLDAAARAAQLRVPVYTMLLGNDPGRPGQLSPTETLSAIANQTGGVFTQSTSTGDLRRVFQDIGTSITAVRQVQELTVWAVLAAIVLLVAAAGALAASEVAGAHPSGAQAAGPSRM